MEVLREGEELTAGSATQSGSTTEAVDLQLVCVSMKVLYKTVDQARPDGVQHQQKR